MKQNLSIKHNLLYENKIFIDADKNVVVRKRCYKLVCSKLPDKNYSVKKVYVDQDVNLDKKCKRNYVN